MAIKYYGTYAFDMIKMRNAFKKYTFDNCHKFYDLNRLGNGSKTIAFGYGMTTRQVDAAINAYINYLCAVKVSSELGGILGRKLRADLANTIVR
jgi:hypothetical protein